MTNVVALAAREFLNDEAKRQKRPRFTQTERETLEWHLKVLEAGSRNDERVHAQRGFAAVDLIGYAAVDREDGPVNVIADILHHAAAVGLDPMIVLAHARAEFYRDKGADHADDHEG